MKITGINPLIVTKDSEPVLRLFEELGFAKNHSISAVENNGVKIDTVCMKDANGFAVDVSQAPGLERDLSLIRINVDDFDEAFEMLKARGFKNVKESEETLDTTANKSAMIVSPSGFAFDLCQHIKD